MAVSVKAPLNHVEDNNGEPIVAAKQYVYEAGTTTLRPVYTDPALSTPADNPQISDAKGDFPRVFTAAGTYKIRQETSLGLLIAEWDDIDSGLSSGSSVLPISGGGTGSTTAAGARTNLDVPSNSELSDLATTISNLQSIVQNIVSAPQGRLTPTTGTPVIGSSVSAGTSVFYTAYTGNIVPIYDGAQFNARAFAADLSVTLNSNHVANAIYDVFMDWDGSQLRIGTGPAWNTASAGAGSRGAGAGTTEITRVGGLWVNRFSITARNGATTYAIDPSKGTYLGSIFMDGTNGQVSCHVDVGQSRKFGVWNAYNRATIVLQEADPGTSWAYGTNTVRPSNNSSSNSISTFTGLAEEEIELLFNQVCQPGGSGQGNNGIGWNSTTAYAASSKKGSVNSTSGLIGELHAMYVSPPGLGMNVATALENAPTSVGITFFGAVANNMLMTARYRG